MRATMHWFALVTIATLLCAAPRAAGAAVSDVQTSAQLRSLASLRSNAARAGETKDAPADFSEYDDATTSRVTLDNLRARGHAEQSVSVSQAFDSLFVHATGSTDIACSRNGDPEVDDRSGAGGVATLSVSFTVTERSRFTFSATVSVQTQGSTDSSNSCVDFNAGDETFRAESADSRSLPSSDAVTKTGILAPGSYSVTAGTSSSLGSDQTSCRTSYSLSLSVSPAPQAEEDGAEIRWTRVSGGGFGAATNWDAGRVPTDDGLDQQDTAIFDLDRTYAVGFAPAKGPKALGAPQKSDRLLVTHGNVTFHDANYRVDALTPEVPSLFVDRAKLTIASGLLDTNSALIGALSGTDSEVAVTGPDATWTCRGRLRVGAADGSGGAGKLTIAAGADVTSVDTRIGAGGAQKGTATISGGGSTWDTDNLQVGFSSPGVLRITDGAAVTSAAANVGGGFVTDVELGTTEFVGIGSDELSSIVVVRDVDAGGSSATWNTTALRVGEGGGLAVAFGGRVNATEAEVTLGGLVRVDGVDADQGRAALFACNSLEIRNGHVEVLNGGAVEVVAGDLEAGRIPGTTGRVTVSGTDAGSGLASSLHVDGLTILGGAAGGVGSLEVSDGGRVTSDEVQVGTAAQTVGVVQIGGAETSWSVTGSLFVGADPATQPGSTGLVVMNGGVLSASGTIDVRQTGSIQGTGNLVAPTFFVDGFISASVAQGAPITPSKAAAPAVFVPGRLTIQGDLALGPTGEIRAEAGGPDADQVVVTGDATLDGRLVLQFMNGYAPRAGEIFEVLDVDGATAGAFAAVEVRGLAPGAQFVTAFANGVLVATAQNDTTALPVISIKPLAKKLKEKSRKPAAFKLTRKGDRSQALTVAYEVGGTAENGVDCLLLSGTATIPAGKSAAKIAVRVFDDPFAEGDETLTIRVLPGTGHTHGVASTAVATIVDND